MNTKTKIEELISMAIQGVQEMPRLPKVEIGDSKGIAKNMEHYYNQRAKWVSETADSIMSIIDSDVIRTKLKKKYWLEGAIEGLENMIEMFEDVQKETGIFMSGAEVKALENYVKQLKSQLRATQRDALHQKRESV